MGLCYRAVLAIILFFVVCLFASAFAGNKKMVDKRTVEMDDQNKQMVRQIPNLPKNGTVDAKARVITEEGSLVFDIYHVKTSVKEESLDFSGKKKNTKEGLIISEPETNTEISGPDDRQQETVIKDISSSDVQEYNGSLNDTAEQNKEEINTELISEPETDIQISDLNDNQQEVTNAEEPTPNSEADGKNESNLNIEHPEEITNVTPISDIKVKNEAANSMATETQQNN